MMSGKEVANDVELQRRRSKKSTCDVEGKFDILGLQPPARVAALLNAEQAHGTSDPARVTTNTCFLFSKTLVFSARTLCLCRSGAATSAAGASSCVILFACETNTRISQQIKEVG